MQQTRTHKAVTWRIQAKKLLSRRRQSEYSHISRVHMVATNPRKIESWGPSFQVLFQILSTHTMKNIGFNLEILAQWPQGLPLEMKWYKV